MSKKAFIFIFTLVFGMIAFSAPVMTRAATVDFKYGVLQDEFAVRGSQRPLFAEVPFAEKNWYGDKETYWGISGMGLGIKGPDITPFYAKLQFNWKRSTQSDEYYFLSPEVGLGFNWDLWEYTGFGAEISAERPSLKNVSKIEPRLEVYFSYDFAILDFDPENEP